MNNYCVVTQTGVSSLILNIARNLEGAVQLALGKECTLQGGVSISQRSKANISDYFVIFSQAVLCPNNISCSQVDSIESSDILPVNNLIIGTTGETINEQY